jgi:glycosyltransferase involved in cell wall biosynthesis
MAQAELADPRIHYVHEWLTEWGGSEDVTRAMLQAVPGAALHATIDFLKDADRRKFGAIPIRTTFLQKAPFARDRFWHYLPLTPLAVETHDLRGAQVILSSSHAFAKGVLTTAEQLHVSYVHSPMRYAWDLHHEYLADYRLDRGLKGLLARYMFHRLRQWDRQTANNVDLFLANSRHVQRRIWRAYRRVAQVLHPPVAVSRFRFEPRKGDHYVTVSRLVSYKRIDLLLEAFRAMPQRKLVVIGDGAYGDSAALAAMSERVNLEGAEPRFVPIGKSGKNLSITEFSVRRYPLDKSRYEVMLEVTTLNELVAITADVAGVKPPSLRLPVWPFWIAGAACEAVCRPLGIEPPIYRRRVDFFTKSRAFDSSLARAEIGFALKIGLREGIGRTLAWYREAGWL